MKKIIFPILALLLIAGSSCQKKFDTEKEIEESLKENEGLSSNTFKSIWEDSNGNLWFSTRSGGMSTYNGETFTHYKMLEKDNGEWESETDDWPQ